MQHPTRRLLHCLLLALLVVDLKPIHAQSPAGRVRISGIIVTAESSEPISGARVRIGNDVELLSDDRGRFAVDAMKPGQYQFQGELLGRAVLSDSITIPEQELLWVDVRLAADPIRLAPIEITVEVRSRWLEQTGFYGRRDHGFGVFVDREEIEYWNPPEMSDLFSRVPGVDVISANPLQRVVRLRGGRGGCGYPSVWLDGMMVHRGGTLQPAMLDDLIRPVAVAGIEVYRSASELPIEFSGPSAACGVIVIWTGR